MDKNLKISYDNLILKISFAQKKSNTHKKLYTTSTTIQRGKFKAKKNQNSVDPGRSRPKKWAIFGEKCSKIFFGQSQLLQLVVFKKSGKIWITMRWLGSVGPVEAELWLFENWCVFQKMAIFQNFEKLQRPNQQPNGPISLDPIFPHQYHPFTTFRANLKTLTVHPCLLLLILPLRLYCIYFNGY